MSTVGVVGAGVMGAGAAQALSQAGHDVVLVDVAGDVLDHAMAEVRRGVRMSALLGGGRHNPDQVVARIHTTTAYEDLGAADFVIENTTERLAVKREVYPRLDAACRPETVFAANTSAVLVAEIASWTNRPDRVLGMHLMNPVPLKKAVEVIRGPQTSDATLATALDLLASMGKQGITVNDAPGFVTNRVLMLEVNEAARVLSEGTAGARDIDRIFRECFEHKMGPLETADLIGLDTIVDTLDVLREQLGDPKYEPCELLAGLVRDGHHGRKTGRGFHDYAT
jgi:3-hydroxybutyryl-CoA dehydrogenase